MATQPTQLPVPSEKPQDLKFNAGKIDEYVTSMGWTYTDRFGNKHYTIEGINYLAQQVMNAFGYITLTGVDFDTGATVSTPNEVLFNPDDNSYYKWTGSFASGAKLVPANSTPQSAGGIGPGKWMNVGDTALRNDLAKTDSTVSIAGITAEQVASNTIKTEYVERDSDVYDVIIAYGQSNALGSPVLSGDVSGFPAPMIRSLMYDVGDGTIKPIIQNMASTSGETSTGHAWGEFANEWYRCSGHGSVVVMAAKGAQAISSLQKGDTSGLYDALISGVNAAKSRMSVQGLPVGKTYVLFHQGEGDQGAGTTFNQYVTVMARLVDDLRSDLAIDRFANCTVGCPTNRPEISWAMIQNAQRFVAQGRDYCVTVFDYCPSFSTRDGNIGSEGVHYTQKGLNVMGFHAARNLFSIEHGAVKTRTESDLLQYDQSVGAPWMRAQRFAAVMRYSASSSSWVPLSKDNSDTFVRPINVNNAFETGDYMIINLASRPYFWSEFNVSLSKEAESIGLTAVIERAAPSDGYSLKIYFYQDISVAVNTSTGGLLMGRPLSALNSYYAGILSAVASGGVATISHGLTTQPPIATQYAASDAAVPSAVWANGVSTTTTKVKCSSTDNQIVNLMLKKVLITPEKLRVLGIDIKISGTFATEF